MDGGADKLITRHNPDVILGDLDSIKREKKHMTVIVYLEDQSKTDLESVCWCANQGIKELELLGFPWPG